MGVEWGVEGVTTILIKGRVLSLSKKYCREVFVRGCGCFNFEGVF